MAATVSCVHCQALLEKPTPTPDAPVQCPQCRGVFYLPGTGPGAETHIRAGPPPAVTFTADPFVLRKAPGFDWRGFADNEVDWSVSIPRGKRVIRPHRGRAIFAYGLLALFPCAAWLFGVLAITLAEFDLREINAGNVEPAGESLTKWGRLLGYVGIFFWTLVALVICLATPNRF
jgi:phage FluMu protein Com